MIDNRKMVQILALLIMYATISYFIGRASVSCPVCPPCIEQAKAACPSEDIWVNTTYGLVHFEKGEIDANPPYILKKHDIDELYQKIEQEILKQKGEAL